MPTEKAGCDEEQRGKPTKPGLYWFRWVSFRDWMMVEVVVMHSTPFTDLLCVKLAGAELPLTRITAEFRGPIEPPKE